MHMLKLRRHGSLVVVALMITAAAAGCAKAQARTQPERVPLDVPPVPPRVIAPAVVEVVAEEAPEPPAPAAPARPPARPRTTATRETPPPKPEPPKADPVPARQPAPRLRTPQNTSDLEVERKIRESLARSSRALDSVNQAALNPDARTQYDTARRFIQQAEEGLGAKNYVFAGYLADKAETMAAVLVGR